MIRLMGNPHGLPMLLGWIYTMQTDLAQHLTTAVDGLDDLSVDDLLQ